MKTNLSILAAEIVRLLPELSRDKSNAEGNVLNLLRPVFQERDEAQKDWRTRMEDLMHRKFFFQPHPDDAKKCNCAYCARDFEAVAEHAAYMEMDIDSLEAMASMLAKGVRHWLCELRPDEEPLLPPDIEHVKEIAKATK